MPWPTLLPLTCKGVKGESPPLHPTEKEHAMVMDHKVMANSPFSLLGIGVEDVSPPLHPTEKDQGIAMDHNAMANSPSSYL